VGAFSFRLESIAFFDFPAERRIKSKRGGPFIGSLFPETAIIAVQGVNAT
jgi:hypothetical protein